MKKLNHIKLVKILCLVLFIFSTSMLYSEFKSGEQLFSELSRIINKGDVQLFEQLNEESRTLDWTNSKEIEFVGNLRVLKVTVENTSGKINDVYLLRKLTGEVFVLSLPEKIALLKEDANSFYAGLDKMIENKMVFKVKVVQGTINNQVYYFAKFISSPNAVLLDKIFKIFIILMLFFVMVGIGLTLTLREFGLVFKKPRGIIIGEVLQFGLLPLLAFGVGHLLGFYQHFPFIFVGMILITASPGGVTSNLLTYYAKGDLALSISLTSFSTVLSLIFTPLLLTLYCTNLPEVTIPVKLVIQTILILVIIPLFVGMSIRAKLESFAKKAIPFFSALGLIALLILIIAGVLSNLNAFADTDLYGFKFYLTVFLLTFLGMFVGLFFSKLTGINNYQTRAISLETGIRNASLAMTIALLIQDAMGDFYSSMFFTSGIFGIVMYIAGAISIFFYKSLLPIKPKDEE